MLSEARRSNLRNWFSALRWYLPALLTPDGLDDLQILGVTRGTVRHVFPVWGRESFDSIWHPCQLLKCCSSGTANPLRVGIVPQHSLLQHALYPPGLFCGRFRHKTSVYATNSRTRGRTLAAEPACPAQELLLDCVGLLMKLLTDLLPCPAVQVEADDEPEFVS